MSNAFPLVPTNYALASIEYDVAFPNATQTAAGLTFTGVSTSLTGAAALGIGSLAVFTFNTPGTFGSFDQTTAETALKVLLNDCCQFLADATGDTLASVQAGVRVTRRWTWKDPAGNTATFMDTMIYP